VVFISNDVNNVMNGFFKGAMIQVVILWFLGFLLLVVNSVLLFVDKTEFNRIIRRSGILMIISGLFFLFSIIVHYGPLFHNSSGIAIPLGLPLIFLIGIWMYRWADNDENRVNTEQSAL
jgi:CHASE2 domain-containing sensor protein